MTWNPDQYNQFQAERAAPFDDLWRMIEPRPSLRVLDLGCGDGHLTRLLADRLPFSDTLGVDASPQMLARAQSTPSTPTSRDGLRFALQTIEAVCDDPNQRGAWDLVFSNAAIQWVPDHDALLPKLFALVAPNGQLALQLPSNHTHPSHTLLAVAAAEPPFAPAFNGWTRQVPVLPIDRYAALLHAEGGCDLVAFEKVYPHLLPDADAMADWTRATACLPYLDRLPPDLHAPFLDRYRALLRAHFPQSPIFYGFRRTLLYARQP